MEQSAKLPLKVTIASLVFVLVCLLSTARILSEAPSPAHRSADQIANLSDQRFAALKQALPKQGVIGYVGESGNVALGQYYLTQYALAPLVVDQSPNHSLVIGNFPTAQPPASHYLQLQDLQLVKDFGNGVLLFANKDAK